MSSDFEMELSVPMAPRPCGIAPSDSIASRSFSSAAATD